MLNKISYIILFYLYFYLFGKVGLFSKIHYFFYIYLLSLRLQFGKLLKITTVVHDMFIHLIKRVLSKVNDKIDAIAIVVTFEYECELISCK